MPLGLGGNPSFYYTPPPPNLDFANSDWGLGMMEDDPSAAFYRYGQTIGIPDDQSGFGRWFRQQFPQFNTGYHAYTISNPVTADIRSYAESLGGYDQWMRQYNKLAPQMRGEDPASRGAGPVRWIGR